MSSFVNAIKSVPTKTRTTNGMATFTSSMNANVDLFFQIGAARTMAPKAIKAAFARAFGEDPALAMANLFYGRDIRQGAGERKTFIDLLVELERRQPDTLKKVIPLVAEYGRWDDLFHFSTGEMQQVVFEEIRKAIFERGDGLCAKWVPRKGRFAESLRAYLGLSPKRYRKTLVTLTKVVETQMCANQWTEINFSHVPSQAARIYSNAFKRHAPEQYQAYIDALTRGDDPSVKINANAVFPHDVLAGVKNRNVDARIVQAQWDALPNYLADGASILPMVDTSGSMGVQVGKTSTTAMDIAVAIGLYLAEKNVGKFKGAWLNFSSTPKLRHLEGDIVTMYKSLYGHNDWGGSTNIESALNLVLNTAKQGNVPPEEMPKMLLIMSDMQFNHCTEGFGLTALQMFKKKYRAAGYECPQIVFWNINAHADQAPTLSKTTGVALVSGASPSIIATLLGADPENFTPEGIMRAKLLSDRYAPVIAAVQQ